MRTQSLRRVAWQVGIAVLAAALAAPAARAQSTSARVEGVVLDGSGAPIPGVTVTALNTATGRARSAVSDAAGNYVITPLAAAPYRIDAVIAGFKPAAATALLEVNEVARIDFRLQVGAMSETVEVTSRAPVIEKSTSFLGTVVDNEQIQNLPLNGRNFTQLTTLTPGVTRGTPGSVASGESGNAETFRYGESGGGAISVNGLREQFNNFLLDGMDNNEILANSVVFFPSIEALQEFRVITTNAPAEFGRAGGAITNLVTKSGGNEWHGSAFEFTRNDAFDSKPTFVPPDQDKPSFRRNEFGATLGGPIVKDRTFFFVSYKGVRDSVPVEAGGKVTVPTARMRAGDFSELLDPHFTGGAPITIYDPLTGAPFPGNVIPGNRIDPAGRRYLSLFPLPDAPGMTQNYFTHRQRKSRFNDLDARIDHTFGSGDSAFVRVSRADDGRFDPGRVPGYQAGFGSGSADAKGTGGVLGETHLFSPSVINELRVGYNRYSYDFLPVGFGTDQDEAVGIPGPGGITLQNGLSLVGGGNGNYVEYLGDFGQYVVKQRTLHLSDSVTVIRGTHDFKVGVSVIRRSMDTTQSDVGKGFYFFSDFVATPGNVPPLGQTGYEVADMLAGRTQFTATGVPGYTAKTTISWEDSVFVQDDWRATRKLTLNLGLRYDVFTPYYEKQDRLANFDPATGGLVLAGRDGASRSTVSTDKNNFGPRLGLAYQIDDLTVVRGAYGRFFSLDRGGIANQLTQNPPFQVIEYRFDGPLAHVALSDPIALPSTVDPAHPDLPQGSGVVYIPKDTKTTQVDQWSVSAQRALTPDTALMVAYVGTRGHNLTAIVSTAGFSGGILGRLTSMQNIATSRYNAFQATLRKSSPSGFSYLASYTFGHARNNSPGPFPGQASAFRTTPTDPTNLGLDEGDADFDVRHRFTLAATYPLPFFRSSRVLGGWMANAIIALQTGTPYTVFDGNGRADLVAGKDPNKDPDNGPRTPDEWFDRSAFTAHGTGQTAERNSVRGPGTRTIDASLFKTFRIAGRTGLELRFEAFNITNTPQYQLTQDNLALGGAQFGKITSTRLNSERQIQLAARLSF